MRSGEEMKRHKTQELLAQIVRNIKIETGLTYRQISKKAKLKESKMNRILNCDKRVSFEVALLLAKAFDIDLNEFKNFV